MAASTRKIDPLRLTGTDIGRKPDYIRITAIDEHGGGQTPTALQRFLPAGSTSGPAGNTPGSSTGAPGGNADGNNTGAPNGSTTGSHPGTPGGSSNDSGSAGALPAPGASGSTITLGVGSIVPFAAFRHLSWNADGNDGGSFSFVPSTADGRPLEGATEQHVQIRESSIPPDYSAPSRLDVPHEQAATLPASLLGGQDASHAPARILIQAIELNEAPAGSAPLPADAASRSLFILQDDGERRYLSAGQSVDRQDFERLHWDGATNAGGSFRIEPREADGEAIMIGRCG